MSNLTIFLIFVSVFLILQYIILVYCLLTGDEELTKKHFKLLMIPLALYIFAIIKVIDYIVESYQNLR